MPAVSGIAGGRAEMKNEEIAAITHCVVEASRESAKLRKAMRAQLQRMAVAQMRE